MSVCLPDDSLPQPLVLPGVWHAHALPAPCRGVWPTGHQALDAELPGGGWPVGALVEVLQSPAYHHEWQLVLPALVAGCGRSTGVVLVAPPHTPFMPALSSQGLCAQQVLVVAAEDPVQRLWACEQALQCPQVGAVLAWLPHAPMGSLRRLQHAAARWGGVLWVFRPSGRQVQASPAVLRLALAPADTGEGVNVRVLKRRGPPMAVPVPLTLTEPGLQAVLAGARWRHRLRQAAAQEVLHVIPHVTVAGRRTAHA